MKSVVFSFKKSASQSAVRRRVSTADIKYLFRRYGVRAFFVVMLLAGLTLGAVYSGNADSKMLSSLDFLFTTNLDARLSQSFFGTFCACFASDFIFLFAVYLLGFAPWGIPVMSLAVMFKGFGTGITAGYLFVTNSLSGVGFYLLVLLPGTFLFCVALVIFSGCSFEFSKRMLGATVCKNVQTTPLRSGAVAYSSRFLTALIMTFCASLLDTALWVLFAGAFKF